MICKEAFNFPVPLRPLRDNTAVLELFHGPTAAFKDIGARFLARALMALSGRASGMKTVLVATSGDTGGAVAGAFFNLPGTEVVILFPKGRISARQEKQLTAWGGNVRAFAIAGTFDDCQRLVKEAFLHPEWQASKDLLSANSINVGRLLPQAAYYAMASMQYQRTTGQAPGFIIPSGNLGNAIGALWAKSMGFPVREVYMAFNANRPVPDFLESGLWKPHPTIATLANAMDVGNPSNFERLRQLFPEIENLRQVVRAATISDDQIRTVIAQGPENWGEIWCPHTATAVAIRETLSTRHWIVVATAHPAKFESIVEPLIGREVPIPDPLAEILLRPSRHVDLPPDLQALRVALDQI